MKKIILLLTLALGTFSLMAQSGNAAGSEDLVSIAPSHDFGTIRQGRPVTYDFTLTNTGKEVVKIDNVAASCGCTTPKWSGDAIAPGQSTLITVGYNAAAEGLFEKSVTISYNGIHTKTIYIKGQVAKSMPSAPPNSSVTLLKQVN
ncbi:DUF1573 domain-containing protein [Flavihumibacter profundi]|jgi:hypothetical protein|uniref:DUF1573 domain-containing protein n=1 Tax=Flavihumibacter profundi TaxID=2716883 RepID=UPI001CC52802|nr:DUF1573 domain-containing protein [Flavihumibacter profundi]MBZ5857073.1 DUF1573 domain-containing protein [Flavihumibacter profundi]